jgi:hypothetical protein
MNKKESMRDAMVNAWNDERLTRIPGMHVAPDGHSLSRVAFAHRWTDLAHMQEPTDGTSLKKQTE